MQSGKKNAPIGIFDSGVGGLEVYKEFLSILPKETIYYYADCQHFPYGRLSSDEIIQYTYEAALFLTQKKVKALVLACHTASTAALEFLKKKLSIPVYGISQDSLLTLFDSTKNRNVGIIGTKATVRSGYFTKELLKLDPKMVLHLVAAPELVSYIEKGEINPKKTKALLKMYLKEFEDLKMDALFLACTHFSHLFSSFQELLPNITVVDPSKFFVEKIKTSMIEKKLLSEKKISDHIFFTSGSKEQFNELASRFLSSTIFSEEAKI